MKDLIRVHGLALECILGILPHERVSPQRIVVDVTLEASLTKAARSGRIHQTIDYDRVTHEVSLLLQFREYQLLEMAAEEICAMLLGIHTESTAVRVQIEKPAALPGRARAASVEFYRTPADFAPKLSVQGGSRRTLLLTTREAQLEAWRVEPGESISCVPEFEATGIQWLTSGVAISGSSRLGTEFPGGAQRLLSRDCPRLIHSGSESAQLFRCWRRL